MTPGERVAQVAHELLDIGPMGRNVRRSDYYSFIQANFDDTIRAPVFLSAGTHCAIFVRGCLVQADIAPRGHRPERTAITTWLGVRGFKGEPSWIPESEWTPEVGDIPYISGGNTRNWQYALNGHVFILIDGIGAQWVIAQGGGGKDGSLCRQSEAPIDIYRQTRIPRGAWRPALMRYDRAF